MSTKRLKQYLLLLTAIGLIAIASGGSGTFASFTAEVNNPGNTFSTGELYLHDSVTNAAECTSESANNNSNTAESVGDACDSLFTLNSNSQFAPNGYVDIAGPNTTGALTGAGITTIDVRDWNGGTTGLSFGIADNAEVQITQGANTVICTVNGAVAQGADTITVDPCDFGGNSYNNTAVISSEGPYLAHLTLRNAGTIDGSDLKFALDSVAHSPGCDQTVDGLNSSTTLCANTDFTITETDSSWSQSVDYATGAITGGLGCAYGTLNGTSDGCVPDSNQLSDVTTQNPTTFSGTWTSLNLANTAGQNGTNNTRQLGGLDSTVGHSSGSGPGTANADPGTGLTNPGGARYFLVEIWPGDLSNNDQGASEIFDVIWHMDQA